MSDFHEVLFPSDIALGARGGPERRTDLTLLGSGREIRNARWARSRRRYEAGYGVKTVAALEGVLAFFEERRGRLHGFRWRDRLDCKSCSCLAAPAASDQILGAGDGARARFQLVKTYGAAFAPYLRTIGKPVAGSVLVAVDGVARRLGAEVDCDMTTGLLTFRPDAIPGPGAIVTAGFVFDVPVRFDTDRLEVDLAAFDAGEIPHVPLVEIMP